LWIWDGPVAPTAMHLVDDHRHGYWVWLLREGKVSISMGKEVWEAKVGQWIVSPHGLTLQQFSEGSRILSVHFRCEWPTGENLFEENDGLIVNAGDYPNLERSASRFERLVRQHFPGVRLELLQRQTNFPVFLKVQQRFLQWLIDFYEMMVDQGRTLSQGGSGDERLWRAAECLHSAPLSSPFPAEQLQRDTSLGRAQLDRLFLKEFGTTPREYWERLRQESALSILESTSKSIKEIGFLLAFKQPSHFTKWFTRRVGITPQEYRIRAKEPQFARSFHSANRAREKQERLQSQ
jgi:AraC-like DNA-binding protein